MSTKHSALTHYQLGLLQLAQTPRDYPKRLGGGVDRCHGDAGRATQKKQRHYYSGKCKCHTLKSQVVLDAKSHKILCTAHAPGSKNDLTLLRDHNPHLQAHVWVVADGSYRGLANDHAQSCLPVRKPRKGKLKPTDKAHNRALAQFRVTVEHAIRTLKIWRILKDTYRNRRKRFALRFRLIAGLVNANLDA